MLSRVLVPFVKRRQGFCSRPCPGIVEPRGIHAKAYALSRPRRRIAPEGTGGFLREPDGRVRGKIDLETHGGKERDSETGKTRKRKERVVF